jgi:hypothetical protein
MLSYIEIGAAISTLFLLDRNDFEFTFEKAQKKVPPDWLCDSSNAQSSGVPGVVSCGAKTAGREADYICRSTAKLKIPVFGA